MEFNPDAIHLDKHYIYKDKPYAICNIGLIKMRKWIFFSKWVEGVFYIPLYPSRYKIFAREGNEFVKKFKVKE